MEDNNIENGIRNLAKKVEDRLEVILRQVLLKIRTDAISAIDTAKPHAPVNTGELRRNIVTDIVKDVGKIFGIVGVSANVPYGVYVHEGTKKHFPPVFAIQQWILRKGLLKDDKKRRVTVRAVMHNKKNYDANHAALKSMAYAIALKIYHKGTPAIPFLRTAFNLNENFIINKFKSLQLA